MSVHSWCRDIPRDEAVRAAEDGRAGPLPTLEEAIAMIPKTVSASSGPKHGNKGDDMTKSEIQAAHYRAEASQQPFADSPGKCETGDGQSGLRTERVVLEITHDLDAPLGEWIVQVLDESLGYDEYVRVVKLTHFDDLADMALERDAAIRERDKLRSERITQALTADRFAAAVAEADRLRARAAELESAAKLAPAANADGISSSQPISGAGKSAVEEMSRSGQFASSEAATEQKCPERESVTNRRLPAKGWLTEEERLAIYGAILILDQHGQTNIGRTLESLLARSTPPSAAGTELPTD